MNLVGRITQLGKKLAHALLHTMMADKGSTLLQIAKRMQRLQFLPWHFKICIIINSLKNANDLALIEKSQIINIHLLPEWYAFSQEK